MQQPSLSCLLAGVLFFFLTVTVQAQNSPLVQLVQSHFDGKNETTTITPFTILHEKNREALTIVPKAQFLTLDPSLPAFVCQNRPENLIVQIPFKGTTLQLRLVRQEITSGDFSIITEKSNAPAPYISGVHYRGILQGDHQSAVALSFFEREVMGGINTSAFGDLVLGKIAERDNQLQYLLYADHEMTVQHPFSCGTNEEEHSIGKAETGTQGQTEVDKCVRVFLEADNELFLDKGSSIQNTVNYLLGMFNQAATLYANEQINTIVSQIFVWTTPDIYTPTNSATVLNQFKAFRTSFNGDMAHLVGLGGNNLGGIAFVDVLCSSYNYAFSDITPTYSNVPTYSWTVEVFTHEMGHNLGSRHTQWCGWQGGPIDNCVPAEGNCSPGPAPINGGTIMSYCHLTGNGINFNHGFGPQPGNVIRTETAAATCLSASCPVATCDAPIALTITNITGSGASIGWSATNGATGYVLRYRSVGSTQWTSINNPSNPYQITGLPSNDEIEVTVQSLCGSTASDYRNGILFITGASGGSGGGGGTTCDVPGNVQAIPTTTSAQTSWNAVNGANSYSIEWKISTSSTWSSPVTTTNLNYNISGLTAGTVYNVRVSATCNGTNSVFATTSFTTLGGGGGGTTCNAPTGLSTNATSTTAAVTWVAVTGASGYSIQWKTSTSATWNTAVSSTTNAYSITGLTTNTAYDVRVATTCGTTTSAFINGTFTTSASGCVSSPNLTTLPSPTTALVSWNNVSGATTYRLEWKLASAINWNNSVDLTTTTYTISNLTANTAYHVRISSICGTGTATPTNSLFTTATNSAVCSGPGNFTVLAGTNSASTTWSAVPGAIYYRIQWKLTSATNWNPLVSTVNPNYNIANLASGASYNVRVTTLCSTGISAYTTSTFTTASNAASCGTPTNLTATPNSSGAVLNWSSVAGANSYSVQWKVSTVSNWNSGNNSASTAFTITGLNPSTDYNVRVAAVCNGVVSAYITTSFTTTTQGGCGAPASISIVPSTTTAQAGWAVVNGASAYQVQWKTAASSTWGSLVNTTSPQISISSLTASTQYNIRVRSVCNGISSAFTNGSFTTTSGGGGGTCPTPGNLAASSVNPTSAMVSWSAVGGAASYILRIRVQGATSWFAFTGITGTGVTIQNMNPSTTYEVQIMSNCGNNGSSNWSSVLTFTTPSLLTGSGETDEMTEERDAQIVKLPGHGGGFTAQVMPNPFVDQAQIVLDITEDTPAQITILNAFGQVVSDRQSMIMGGTADLDAPTLKAGVYFVRIRINTEIRTIRIVKQ